MNIEVEWNRRITQFSNPIHRVKSARHSNFNHLSSKRAYVGNYVNVTSPNIGFAVVNFLNSLLYLSQLLGYPRNTFFIAFLA